MWLTKKYVRWTNKSYNIIVWIISLNRISLLPDNASSASYPSVNDVISGCSSRCSCHYTPLLSVPRPRTLKRRARLHGKLRTKPYNNNDWTVNTFYIDTNIGNFIIMINLSRYDLFVCLMACYCESHTSIDITGGNHIVTYVEDL